MASDVQDQEFYNVFDGTDGRPDGVYLDMEERKTAERLRAQQEGRDPRLEAHQLGELPGGVGTPMVPNVRRVDNKVYSNPATTVLGPRDVDPVSTLGVDEGTADEDVDLSYAAMVADERSSQEQRVLDAETSPDRGNGNAEDAPPVNNTDLTV